VGFFLFRLMEYLGWKLFRKEALGGGDKFLMALLGAFLTWKALLGIIFLSSLQGALVGGALLLTTGRAGPAPQEEELAAEGEGAPEPELTMTWEFLAPGLPLWRRLLLLPYSLLLQPIPDDPKDAETGEEVDWVPGATNIPFGPWLALAGLEVMLLGPWLAQALPTPLDLLVAGPV
jgi:leader peptidase (prepilin peptidase)/N-methyltransferase